MKASKWIKAAQMNGWRLDASRNGVLTLACKRQGCPGRLELPLANLGPTPDPCSLQHHGQYGMPVFNLYRNLVIELIRRRRRLGLSQEDVNGAAGFADGHLSKLESFARIGQFPTMVAWANTLGTDLALFPAPFPDQIALAVKRREALLRESEDRTGNSKPDETPACNAP